MSTYRTEFKLDCKLNDYEAAKEFFETCQIDQAIQVAYELSDIKDEILSIAWILENENSGYIELTTLIPFDESQLKRISDWVSYQCSDGLGDEFKQEDCSIGITEDGEYTAASFDFDTNAYIFEQL